MPSYIKGWWTSVTVSKMFKSLGNYCLFDLSYTNNILCKPFQIDFAHCNHFFRFKDDIVYSVHVIIYLSQFNENNYFEKAYGFDLSTEAFEACFFE